VNFAGDVMFSDGTEVGYGSIVDAYVYPNVRCGSYFVTEPGTYGLMPVYRDDSTTPEKDGALPGDVVRFAVNGMPAVALGPDASVWTKNGDFFNVNLLAGPVVQRVIHLYPGWNLISFDVMPANPTVAGALVSIAGRYTRLLAFDCTDGALSYYPSLPPSINTLKTMDALHGYWIEMTMESDLVVVGIELPDATPIPLCVDYNLVSYLPQTSMSVLTALSSISGNYLSVMGFDPLFGAQSFYPDLPPLMNTLTTMGPGRGYWIKASAPDDLIYP